MDSVQDFEVLPPKSFLIQKSSGQSLFGDSPGHIAANHVFHRFLLPGNPPHTLHSLIIKYLNLPKEFAPSKQFRIFISAKFILSESFYFLMRTSFESALSIGLVKLSYRFNLILD